MNLDNLIEIVDQSLELMGIKPEDAKNEEQGQWFLMNEEMPIYLDAWQEQQSTPWNYFKFNEDATVFQITIPFCYAPTLKREAFLEELLIVNLNLHYGKFSYNPAENIVALVYRIPGSDLKLNGISSIVDALGYYAEMTYHVLKDEFGLKRVNVQENQ